MSTDLIEMDLRQALDAASDEIMRLRAALEEIAAITILPVLGYQKKAVQIARKALAKEEGK